VTAAVLEKDGRIIIAQRKSKDHLAGKWEFPGGKIEPGETPEECLARELNEEFNITVREMNVKHSNLSRDLQSLATLSKTIMKQKEFEIAHQLDDPVRIKRTRLAGKQMNKKFMKMMRDVIPTERDKEKVIRATERFIELIDEKSIKFEDYKRGIGNK
jgi:mutator protein MutT